MASGNDICRVKYWINSTEGLGFSESFYIATGDRAIARDALSQIVKFRSALLAGDMEIVYATVSRINSEKDGLALDLASVVHTPVELLDSSTTVDATPVVAAETGLGAATTDVIERGILARFFTFSGFGRLHLMRGIRDTWIASQALLFLPDFSTSFGDLATTAVADGAFTPEAAVGNFLTTVAGYTVGIKKTAPDTYTTINWDVAAYRRIGKRDTGAGFSLSKGRKAKTI